MAKVSYPEALREASRPHRLVVLAMLADLEAGSPGALFPLSNIARPDIPVRSMRTALRSLYKTGLITAREGGYGLTYDGRTILGVLMHQLGSLE